jgi:alpha-galactosidase
MLSLRQIIPSILAVFLFSVLHTTAGAEATFPAHRLGEAYVDFAPDELTIGNSRIERRWAIRDGLLYPTSLFDKRTGKQWLQEGVSAPAPLPAQALAEGNRRVAFSCRKSLDHPVEAPSLIADVTSEGGNVGLHYRFQIFEDSPGVLIQLISKPLLESPARGKNVLEDLHLQHAPEQITQVILQDRTDDQEGELAFDNVLQLGRENNLSASGILFFMEDPATGSGLLLLKHAPLPEMQPVPPGKELVWSGRENRLTLHGQGTGLAGGKGYRFATLCYPAHSGGRTFALQDYGRCLRRYDPNLDGLFVSNTWGDTNRDSRVNSEFMFKELAAGKKLGVDILEIDDGWMHGSTKNSVKGGGVWLGYWDFDPNFWEVDMNRFPDGLEPLVEEALDKNMRLGLWYGPDSYDNFANWRRDANKVLELHHRYHVNHFKFDSMEIPSVTAERRMALMMNRLLVESDGQIVIDLDATAGQRSGYFRFMQNGPIFVENRYTDYGDTMTHPKSYWPHKTLRNFWHLVRYVDPLRLRMEFLNNTRNDENYKNHPLRPSTYQPDYLFASVMFSSPLGWFENSNLPESYFEQVAPLVKTWKDHREEIFSGHVVPIGQAPDGHSWTGFLSVGQDSGHVYALVFREMNDRQEWQSSLDFIPKDRYEGPVLGGIGKVSINDGVISVSIPEAKRFVFARLEKD